MDQVTPDASAPNESIDQLLARINGIVGGTPVAAVPQEEPAPVQPAAPVVAQDADQLRQQAQGDVNTFWPKEPETMYEAGISAASLEEIIAKYLLAIGEATIRAVATQVAMPFKLVEEIIVRMKQEQQLTFIDSQMNDYVCKLTDIGRDRARRYSDFCSYFGAAPVSFSAYIKSVTAQTINDQSPSEEDLARAFSDLLIDPAMMVKLGPAVNSGRGMFLFGYPGNGKTSIAERITAAFGPYVWIPRSISMDRDIVRIFDPMSHVECPIEEGEGLLSNQDFDSRWVRIRRPTIIVGGELTMSQLEIQYNPQTGISCLLYTSPSPRDKRQSRMPSSA